MDLLGSSRASETLKKIWLHDHGKVCGGISVANRAVDHFFWIRFRRADRGNGSFHFFSHSDRENEEAASGTDLGRSYRLCNLVLQGGGTLGLAHAGFITGLENAGIRFAGLAGTSAGSILAMAIAAIRGGDLSKSTHQKVVELAQSVPMDQFIDGPRPIRVTIKRALQGRKLYLPQYWLGVLASFRRLKARRGLNQGEIFESWLNSVLADQGFATIEDLTRALETIWRSLGPLTESSEGLFNEALLKSQGAGGNELTSSERGLELLKLVTTAMPIGMKFNLPEHLRYLAPEYASISPARLVRTSMSIPLFFEPVVMRTDREKWPKFVNDSFSKLLSEQRQKDLRERDVISFLDGGLISNLPSDAFQMIMPEVPTITVPLISNTTGNKITQRNSSQALLADVAACATAVRLQRDREMVQSLELERKRFDKRSPKSLGRASGHVVGNVTRIFPNELAPIDTGDSNWLNFVMSDNEKIELFMAGLDEAERFLDRLGKEDDKQNSSNSRGC